MTFDIANAWKIERDSYYYPLCLQYGYDFIIDAGFFQDTSQWVNPEFAELDISINDRADILCTPFGKLTTEAVDRECVLITTGGFAPVHSGHINMLKSAKAHLEYHGWNVINGYFSPDHDEYIQMKCNHQAVDIFSRITALNNAIKDDGNDWMFVDPWSGVFKRYAINFTEVVDRLKYYLQHHLKRHIPVFFVCGADNARFANTFINTGHCVVVGRPKYEDRFWKLQGQFYPNGKNHSRIYFAYGDTDQSSTEVRKTLPNEKPTLKDLMLITSSNFDNPVSVTYAEKVKDTLAPYFKEVELCWKDSDDLDDDIINLDKNENAKYNLNFSRCYDLFGGQSKGYVPRFGHQSIESQMNRIPKGEYRLYDSDIATGGTVKFVTEQLAKHGVTIIATETLLDGINAREEILDVEDFLLYSGDGLVIKLPNGKLTRAPYMLPYVDCRARCSVLEPIKLSIDMWKLNYEYFNGYERYLAQYPQYLELFSMIGFNERSPMSSICEWHIQMLERHLMKI